MAVRKSLAVERVRYFEGRDLTTGQVATLCGVAPRTVTKWMDAKRIGGVYYVGRDRRVPRDEVVAFMRANGMGRRIPKEWACDGIVVQMIDLPDDVAADVATTLTGMNPATKVIVSRGLVAIAEAAIHYPHLVLADVGIGRMALAAVRQGVAAAAPNYRTYLVGVLPADSDHTVVSAVGYFGLNVAVDYHVMGGARLFPLLTDLTNAAAEVRTAAAADVVPMSSLYNRGG